MGLDMYLYAVPKGTQEVYLDDETLSSLTAAQREERKKGEIGGFNDFPRRYYFYADGVYEVAYWRKANAIHQWFVEHVQSGVDDCGEYVVHPELLADLRDRCEEVLKKPDMASGKLPTQGGFFFGSTEYDDDYFEDLRGTLLQLNSVMSDPRWRGMDLVYSSSW